MHITVDKMGRVTIPKRFRDHFGLAEGSTIEISRKGDFLLLQPSMARREGLLVHLGKPRPDFDWTKIIENEREDRIQEIWHASGAFSLSRKKKKSMRAR
jgi:AbrB family looped-hinge helix DNA binding protein